MNPFKYGQIVTDVDFCPRLPLEKALKEHILSGQNVLIEGERRTGKSSLIIKTANERKDYCILYIDINQIKTLNDLINRITSSLVSLDRQSRFFEKLVKVVAHLRPLVSIDSYTGNPSISFNANQVIPPKSIEQLLEFIYREHSNKQNIVVFDEFQDILNLNNYESIVAILRSRIQFHSNMPYIFSGSVRKNMDKIFYDPDSPFYKSAIKLEIGALEKEIFRNYIKEKFLSGKRMIKSSAIDTIFLKAEENPGDVQELCNAIWSITEDNTRIEQSDLEAALNVIFAREKEFYEHTISLLTNQQLRCLSSIASLGGRSIQSGEFLESSGIRHASSVKKAAARLLDLKILYNYKKEYCFNSPFFRFWLLHKKY
jgi:uncharacterized protein